MNDSQRNSTEIAPATQSSPAGVLRRFGAIIYDTLICVAVLMIATVPFIPFLNGKVLDPSEVGSLAYVYRAWELVVLATFFAFFWTRRGPPVGMQAWRLRVEDESGQLLDWPRSFVRFAYAALPWLLAMIFLSFGDPHVWSATRIIGAAFAAGGVLNLISPWFDRQRRSWHDKLSRSRVVVLPKQRL